MLSCSAPQSAPQASSTPHGQLFLGSGNWAPLPLAEQPGDIPLYSWDELPAPRPAQSPALAVLPSQLPTLTPSSHRREITAGSTPWPEPCSC